MRLLAGAASVLLLLAFLTWLTLRGIDTDATAFTIALQAFDDYELAEASLHRDILQARTGLLRDYDLLERSIAAMEAAAARLLSYAQREGLDGGPTGRLAAAVAKQEELTQRFKSENALLQNSLSYVGLLSTSPAFGAGASQPNSSTSALAAAILQLTRDTSPDSVKSMRQRIDEFAAQIPAGGSGAEPAQALLAHARLLGDLLPASGATLKDLVAVPSRQAIDETRALFTQHRAGLEAATQRFRWLLYFTSLALLAMLVLLVLRLRTRALERRRRAALERVIAENSARLINCPPGKTEDRLRQVLGELCETIGIERAYVVLDEKPDRVIASGAEGAAYPPSWPGQALKLYEQVSGHEPGIIRIGDVADLPPGEAKDALAAAGIGGWACIPLMLPGRVGGIMGFDALQPAGSRIFPLRAMRLAGDAVANAIEREYLERDRARLSAHLERARSMQIIGSVTSGIAHNFNNIIGAVLGYAEMAKPQLAPGSKLAEHIEEIRQAAERGRDLIGNVLAFGRRREVPVREVELKRLVKEAAALLRVSLPTGIELRIATVPDGVAVPGEPAQLQQILLNLCSNAVQAMEGPGIICVTAERKEVAAPLALSHGALSLGQYVCLAVRDTGRGFDETVARRLFEPFFTTRSGGTGLGLATVREIVQDHHGAMNVESEPGRGSRFEVWLPTIAEAGAAGARPLPLGHGQTVMVVESYREPLLRDEEMLAALGYEPVGFERPEDALTACRSKPDRFDVILVSHTPQALEALDLARKLHKIVPARPLLLAVPPSSDISTEALADAGICEILPRPLVSTELAAALARTLQT